MRRSLMLMIPLCAIFLAGAKGCSETTAGIQPCDVLVDIRTKPETNRYLIANDRPAAVGLARNQGRVAAYKCGSDNVGENDARPIHSD